MAIKAEPLGVVFTSEGAVYTLRNGNVIRYKKVNGIYYRIETVSAVVDALENARSSGVRIRVYYGDTATGRDWLEDCDVVGYVSNSIGPLNVPLVIHNRRSLGGPAILEHCIVRIKHDGQVVYQHPSYHTVALTVKQIPSDDDHANARLLDHGYTHAVDVDGKNHANFRSEQVARRFITKVTE